MWLEKTLRKSKHSSTTLVPGEGQHQGQILLSLPHPSRWESAESHLFLN